MKQTLSTLLLAILSLNAFAQDPDPQLFQTWYLSDMDTDTPPQFVEPSIAPTISIASDLSFTGYVACNAYSGQFVYGEEFNDPYLEVSDFQIGTAECEYPAHNGFEINFENVFTTYRWYFTIKDDPEGQWLHLFNPFNSYAVWANYPVLSIPAVKPLQARVYPNPAHGQLNLEFPQPLTDLKLQLWDLHGKLVQEAHYQELLMVQLQTEVPPGLYLLSIQTGAGQQVVKLLIE